MKVDRFISKGLAFRVCLFILAASISLTGCGNDNGTSGRIQPPPPGEQIRVRVDVVSVRTGDIFAPIRATGTVAPFRESRVGAKVSGRLLSMDIVEGDYVSEGQALVELENDEYRLARESAEAQLVLGRASMQEASLNLEYVTREKRRFESLYERQVISRQKYDEILTAHSMGIARVEALEAQVRAAEASLQLAERHLNDTVIRAPFSGYVANKLANQGEVVSAGTPLLRIIDISRVRTEVRIPESDLRRIALGIPVALDFDALPGRTFKGEISEINAAIDPVSRNFTVKIDIPNEENMVKAGMFARITIKTDTKTDVIVVPERALVTDGDGKPAVFVLEEERARFRRVVTGMQEGGFVTIEEGLDLDERVLISGNFGLADDTPVTARLVDY
ncbi:MAG: efflux RND transporter periplasmic adaptor subunit [Syntrophales bacterium]|nr:efflux RND transporter periplasmic adaptor subunit [Syntrophales bacterium]